MSGMSHLTGDPWQQLEFRLHGDTGRNVKVMLYLKIRSNIELVVVGCILTLLVIENAKGWHRQSVEKIIQVRMRKYIGTF